MAGHFRQLSNLGRTELRIGSSMFFCTYVLPDLMKEFQLLYPQVTLTLTEGGILSGSGGAGDHLPALRNSVTCDATDRVVFYQLDDPLASRSVYLSYAQQNTNPVQQNLIDLLKATSSDRAAEQAGTCLSRDSEEKVVERACVHWKRVVHL